jgi:hypothetical protein
LVTITRAQPRHPSLLILDNPLQRLDGILLFPDLLLQTIKTLEDQPHVDAHLVDVLAMTVHSTRHMVDLFLVVLERLLLGNDIGAEVRLQSIALTGRSIRGSTARKGRPHLYLQLKVFRQHSHLDGGRVADCLRRLVQTFIGLLPVKNPSLEKIVENGIVQLLLVQSQQVVMASDHIGPETIIRMEI